MYYFTDVVIKGIILSIDLEDCVGTISVDNDSIKQNNLGLVSEEWICSVKYKGKIEKFECRKVKHARSRVYELLWNKLNPYFMTSMLEWFNMILKSSFP